MGTVIKSLDSYMEGSADKRRRVADVPDDDRNVAPSTTQFCGRQAEVATLHELALSVHANPASPLTGVLVSGFGGIGKTELLKFYAHTYGPEFNGRCVWIHAENMIAMRNSFLKLLQEQQIWGEAEPVDELDISHRDLARKCYQHFEDRGRTLFVFDNAENYDTVKEFLPHNSASAHMVHIFTSRSGPGTDWPPVQFAHLQLGVLNIEDSVSFLHKALRSTSICHAMAFRTLAEELGCYPLALTQAAAYISKENCKYNSLTYTISTFLHAFKLNDSAMELLDYKFWEEGAGTYEKTLYTVLQLSLAKMREPRISDCDSEGGIGVLGQVGHFASEILHRLAFCGADKVPLKLFLHNWPPSFDMGIIQGMGDQECVLHAVELLQRYSMVYLDGDYISIHRLFQRIVRVHAKGQELKYISSLRQMMEPYICTGAADKSAPPSVDPDQRLFIVHALQLCKYTFEYQDALLLWLNQNRNIGPYVKQLVDFHTGEWALLCQHEFYQDALDLARASAALYARGPIPSLGPGSEPALAMRLNTGRTYTKQHFCYKTRDEHSSAYALAMEHLGPHHELTLDLQCHLAWILSQPCLNDRRAARDHYAQCYKTAHAVLGPLHRITVLAKAGIGSITEKQQAALAEYEDVITFEPLLDSILDDESFRIVFTNLQKVYTELGLFPKAYDATNRIVTRLEAKYGVYGIPTLIAKVNLVERLLDLRYYDQARALLESIFTEAQRRLGENRLAFLELREHAATLERETGPDAVQEWVRQVYEDVLTRKKTTLAFNEERHESVIWTEYKVCQLYVRRREYDKAVELGRRVQEKLERLWGPQHGSTCKVKSFLWSVEQLRVQVTTGVWISDYVSTEVDEAKPIQMPNHELLPQAEVRPPRAPSSSPSCSLLSPGYTSASSSDMEGPVEGPMDTAAGSQFDVETLTCSVPPCNGRIFSLRNVFVRHMGVTHHINLYRDKRKERVYSCQYCGKQCGRADNLRSHVRKRHGALDSNSDSTV